jgi:hypothetical protein
MGHAMRPSHPTIIAVGRALAAARDQLVAEWARWTLERVAAAPTVRAATVGRQLGILVDILVEMAGPRRRKAHDLWVTACEGYGRTAAERGLAAGEVVEEIQYLRELLIRHLSEVIAALPGRASMAHVLRLNRLVDTGIAHAVVGYTDALVETLFNQRGVPVGVSGPLEDEIAQRLTQAENELARLRQEAERKIQDSRLKTQDPMA